MYKYYSSRNNLWQTDRNLAKVIETFKHAIELSDDIDSAYKDNSISLKEHWNRTEYLYKEFYKYIGENIQQW